MRSQGEETTIRSIVTQSRDATRRLLSPPRSRSRASPKSWQQKSTHRNRHCWSSRLRFTRYPRCEASARSNESYAHEPLRNARRGEAPTSSPVAPTLPARRPQIDLPLQPCCAVPTPCRSHNTFLVCSTPLPEEAATPDVESGPGTHSTPPAAAGAPRWPLASARAARRAQRAARARRPCPAVPRSGPPNKKRGKSAKICPEEHRARMSTLGADRSRLYVTS